MGLDITAYGKLTYMNPQPETQEEQDAAYEQGVHLYNANGFDRLLQPEGFYTQAEGAAVVRVDCGAYSRYGRWRENLARLAGWPLGEYEQYGKTWPSHTIAAQTATEGPFLELIWFGDNEGCIGPKVSTKLAEDFRVWRESIAMRAPLMHDEGYFMRKYDEWLAAFELAADAGAVVFH